MLIATSSYVRRYSPPAMFFHWAIFLLVLVAYIAINAKGFYARGTAARVQIMTIHEWAGACVLALAVPRLLWRLVRGAPRPEPGPRWGHWLARGAHAMLYVFIFTQPLLGLLTLNAGGHTLGIPGLGVELPALVGPDKALRVSIRTVHEWLGTAFYLVIGLHAMVALFHHYMLGDNTLRRMLRERR